VVTPNVLLVQQGWAAWSRRILWLAGGIAALVLVLAVAWVLFFPVADWLAHHDVGSASGPLHETALDNARGRLLTLGAGLLAAGALAFTARTFYLSREGQVTDRYTRAIDQLGSDKLDVRIGGIYALERIARDSARDHPTVMEVLTAFVREHSREQQIEAEIEADRAQSPGPTPRIRPDVQAAVTVIGRRHSHYDLRHRYLSLREAALAGADLRGADLNGAHLNGAQLNGAHLRGAKLRRAQLRGADLTGARLLVADLIDADLAGAKWPGEMPVPEGWKRDAGTGRLGWAGTGPGPAEQGAEQG
jgi:hypothetical protein